VAPLVFADTTKVPWFIAGGLLAVYAVVLAYVGLHRPDFPYNSRGEKAVIALSTVLAALALAMAIITG
jgi:hypothetical protein